MLEFVDSGLYFVKDENNFMLEIVDSDLYFVQDKNNLINPLLQVGSGSVEKNTGSGLPKINGPDRILIP